MLMTGILISGKMSVDIFSSTRGAARRMSSAITKNVYGLRSATSTIHISSTTSAYAACGKRRANQSTGTEAHDRHFECYAVAGVVNPPLVNLLKSVNECVMGIAPECDTRHGTGRRTCICVRLRVRHHLQII